MFSRRNFLLGSSSAISLCAISPSYARLARGSAAPAALANSNTVINIGSGFETLLNGSFLNLAKNLQPSSPDVGWLGQFNGPNGYPNGALASNLQSLMNWDPAYYGQYVLSWGGQAGTNTNSGQPVIIYSGASATGVNVFGVSPADSGVTAGDIAVETLASTDAADIVFAFGVLLSAVGTNGGLVEFTVGSGQNVGNWESGVTQVKPGRGISGLPAIGPNSDGSWTVNVIDSTHFTLQGSSAFAGSVTITASGGPGTQTEALTPARNNFGMFGPSGTFAGFNNLILCKTGDLPAINAGQLATSGFVSALAASKASYIRFMDMVPVQNTQGISSFADRVVPDSFTWGGVFCPPGYFAGQLTNTSDAFTCANPPNSPSSGAYLDGEVVVAQVGASGQNTTQNPTLNVGSRGAAPIYNSFGSLLNITLSGSVPASGTTISIVFTGGGLATPFTYHYLTSTTVAGPGSALDTSFNNILINIRADIDNNTRGNSGPLLAANIVCVNGSFTDGSSAGSFTYNRNINSSGAAQLNAGFSISASDNGSGTTYTTGLMQAGYLANSNYVSFTFNALLGGWLGQISGSNGGAVQMGGVRGGPPLEYLEELCTRANAGIWYNFGITASSSVIFDTVTHIAQSSVKGLVCEFSNETWNSGSSQFPLCQSLGSSLGLGNQNNSYTGLRIIQMAQQATAAWAAAGRPRVQLKISNAYAFIDMNSIGTTPTAQFRFNGSELNASATGTNVTLKAIGGPANGTSTPTALTTDFSSAPNRPADWSDWVSPAPYWGGGQFNSGNGGSNILGGVPLSAYNGMLLAAYNFAFGMPTQQQAALDFLFNGSANSPSGDLYNGTLDGTFNTDFQLANWALGSGNGADGYWGVGTVVAGYDSSRASVGTGGGAQAKLGVGCYEGGWVMGPIANTGDPSVVAGDLTSLGYTNGYSSSLPGAATGGPTGSSDTAALAGTNLANLLLAWKNDERAFALLSLGYQQFKAAVNVVSPRDAFPCQYGFQGASDWAVYPNLASQSGPFQVINALAAYQ